MDEPIQFPHYDPPEPANPQGTPVADRKQQGPLVKLMTRMMPKKIKPRLLGKMKGIQSDQNVHVKHGKRKHAPRYY